MKKWIIALFIVAAAMYVILYVTAAGIAVHYGG